MFYIKLTEDKDLQVTEREPIYRGENLNGRLIFFLPEMIDELSTEACLVYLSYIRADGSVDVVYLDRLEEKHNETYFQYTLPITSRLTSFPGQVCFFLQIFSGDPINPQIVKTNEFQLNVENSRNMDGYFSDRIITALYQHDKRMKDEFERADGNIADNSEAIGQNAEAIANNSEAIAQNAEAIGQNADAIRSNSAAISQNSDAIRANSTAIGQLQTTVAQHTKDITANANAVSTLTKEILLRADGLIYDPEMARLQLTSGGKPIGNAVRVGEGGSGGGVGVYKMIIDGAGNLIVYYDTGARENLGKVVGEDGKDGAPGKDGKDGKDGASGKDGADGKDGKDGADGKVYVAHIDEHKILTWTVEDAAGEVPDPVDLNPDDEWIDMGDDNMDSTSGKTDYVWEEM